jgi:hypothetical protein
MAQNNPAGDNVWTNTPSGGVTEFDTNNFSDIEVGDLFWKHQDRMPDNHAWRKLDENSAQDTRTQQVQQMHPQATVHQKT